MSSPKKGAGSTRENVKVIVRVRPQNKIELSKNGTTCVVVTDTSIEVQDDGNYPFQFDRVFGWDSTQQDVFEDTAIPLVNDVLNGYNATMLAYGQTGLLILFIYVHLNFYFLVLKRYW